VKILNAADVLALNADELRSKLRLYRGRLALKLFMRWT